MAYFLLVSVAVVLIAVIYLKYFYLPFQVLKRSGFVGPTPSGLYGNHKDFATLGTIKYLEKLHKEYGSIAGFYLGQCPFLSVTDLELIRLITIKDFDYFVNRPPIALLRGDTPGLLSARDETWRVGRQTLSPSFSPLKMKAMVPLIQNSVDALVEVLQDCVAKGKSVEFFRVYGSFTMETLFAAAFGRVIDIQRGHSDHLTKSAAEIFSGAQEGKKTSLVYINTMLSVFPWLLPILRYFYKKSARQKHFQLLQETAQRLIEQRREGKGSGKNKDLLQLMIDSTVEDGSSASNKRKLTDSEIVRYSITFMLAGYETTANALSYTSYLLALNPEMQRQLQEEIDNFYAEHPEPSPYEVTQDLEYLDMVIQESLRLYPPAPRYLRECGKDYVYKGKTIPKGCVINIPSFLVQKDPEYWREPEKFDPLRFTAEEKAKRPQHCNMPFGSGPRNCIGMRFALLEAKIALIEILKRFTFVRAADTQVPLETVLGITLTPKNGIYLKIISR